MKDHQFLNRLPNIIGEENFRKYAVLVPVMQTPNGLCLLFEKRSNNLRFGPGEICFPGGKIEQNETKVECAIRETVEELLIEKNQIMILGPGDILVSPFNSIIYPYLGIIHEYQNTFSKDEVEETILVPLAFFQNNEPDHFKGKMHHSPPKDFPYEWIPHVEKYPWAVGDYDIFFYRYNEVIIWGITARIVKSMIALIDKYQILK